ncbi:hypothetical protein [Micromonospora okii]|uniref:hypothetical protein n=1 Tax=Micromonospora okii TaxID=1182970 RepID=UPI001E2D4752|nr:hypothetical protein [Micromonospora okii]
MGSRSPSGKPFSVILAGYALDFHSRNACSKCTDDGCPRLAWARRTLETWRDRQARRRTIDAPPREGSVGSVGEQIQEAEREAARRRILDLAEAERIPAEETTRAVPDRRWRRGQK